MYLGPRFKDLTLVLEDHLYSTHTRHVNINWGIWRQALY